MVRGVEDVASRVLAQFRLATGCCMVDLIAVTPAPF
jgi:hypothetical protein